jgi:hypothetical protein
VVFAPYYRKLSYWRTRHASRKIAGCTGDHANHDQARGRLPNTCAASAHCLIDRDGRVIGCNLPIGNGPLLGEAPAMAQILRELAAGVSPEQLRARASAILREIERRAPREPGEDDKECPS